MSLHPQFRAYLDALNPLVAQAERDGFVPTPESARTALAGLNQFADAPVPVDEVFERVAGDGVPVRVYVPRPGTPSDVILFVHGGGHMAGDLDVYDCSARRTADATGMVVVSVDYRRSPEALFPAGIEDVYSVLHDLPTATAGIDTTEHVHAVADSGGAAKVSSIAQRVADGRWTSPTERQVLLYPSLDYTLSGESVQTYGTGRCLSAERVAWYFDDYFPDGADRAAASPLGGPYAADMPDTLVIAAENDPLLPEALAYTERMRQAGATAQTVVASGMIHAFAFFEPTVPDDIARLYAVIGQCLRTGVAPATW